MDNLTAFIIKVTDFFFKLQKFYLKRLESLAHANGKTRVIAEKLSVEALQRIEQVLNKRSDVSTIHLIGHLYQAHECLKQDNDSDRLGVELFDVAPHRQQFEASKTLLEENSLLLQESQSLSFPSPTLSAPAWFSSVSQEERLCKLLYILTRFPNKQVEVNTTLAQLQDLHLQCLAENPQHTHKNSETAGLNGSLFFFKSSPSSICEKLTNYLCPKPEVSSFETAETFIKILEFKATTPVLYKEAKKIA